MGSISVDGNWTREQARALQQRLAEQVIVADQYPAAGTVAGVDVGIAERTTVRAAVVVLRRRDLQPLDYALASEPVRFPYVSGLLSFREVPVVLQALERLACTPDLLLVDGQGMAHPRRLGVACHLGLESGLPAVGVAKNRLVGQYGPVPAVKGRWSLLHDQGRDVGAVLRTRTGVKPLFVSPGHRISLVSAVNEVMACVTRYRLPETTRWADGVASGRGQWQRKLDEVLGARREGRGARGETQGKA
jgi:deoxyribonuclease V